MCMFIFLSENSKDSKIEVIKHIRDMLDNIQRALKSNPSTIELQYLRNLLFCNQLRFENIAIDRFQKTEDDLVNRIDTFSSGGCLQNVTLCLGARAQITHVYFTHKLYEKALIMISQVLERIKQNHGPTMQLMSLIRFPQPDFGMLQSIMEPVCSMTFIKLEKAILSADLKVEIYSRETDLGKYLDKHSNLDVNVHPLVYIYYMEYKSSKYLEKRQASVIVRNISAILKELAHQVLRYTAHEYISLNLLGCCLTEYKRYEGAIKVFTKSFRKREDRTSVLYHMATLLRKCF